MNEVKKAFGIDDATKAQAAALYRKSVCKLVNKNYCAIDNDAHTELSAIFGEYWVAESRQLCDVKTLKFINNAFNYANFTLGIRGKFIATAQEVTAANERVSDNKLQAIAAQMNEVLTFI